MEMRRKYTGDKPYFIFVGSLHPRKNLVNLLKAFDHFRRSSGVEYGLIITGMKMFMNREMEKTYRRINCKDDVVFTGQLPDDELAQLLASSEALILVSYFEGFGLPAVEAMMCDVPVIVSNKTSLPEIVGEAGLFADPGDYISISEAMSELVFKPGIRSGLIEKGRIRRQQFSWEKTADGVWQMIETMMQKNA